MNTTRRLERVLLVMMAVGLVASVAVKARGVVTHGERVDLILSALLFTAIGLVHAWHTLGWRRALTFFGLCVVLSGLAEHHSVVSGNVGAYHYTAVLGPKIGEVPLVIPLTWFVMIYPSYIIANLMIGGHISAHHSSWARVVWLSLISAMVMTAWDLSMDPYMSGEVKAWIWEDGGPYFGVPIKNYYGWLHVTFLVNVIYRSVERYIRLDPVGDVTRRVALVPLVIYGLSALTDVVSGSPVDTRLIPIFAMGIPLLAATYRLIHDLPKVVLVDLYPAAEATAEEGA